MGTRIILHSTDCIAHLQREGRGNVQRFLARENTDSINSASCAFIFVRNLATRLIPEFSKFQTLSRESDRYGKTDDATDCNEARAKFTGKRTLRRDGLG